MNKIQEEDLYTPISDYFTNMGYMVRSEVKDCDVTAVRGDELVIVEMKLHLNFTLLVQAVERQKSTDLVYIAVPKPKGFRVNSNFKDTLHLLRRLELGLLFVNIKDGFSVVEPVLHPEPCDRLQALRRGKVKRKNIISEINMRSMDLNKGGTSRKKLMTAYREFSLHIAVLLEKHGALSPKQLMELGSHKKKTTSILNKNYYGWFESPEHGKYAISQRGLAAIEEFKELSEYYRKGVENVKQKN